MSDPVCRQVREQLKRFAFPRTGFQDLNLQFYPASDLQEGFEQRIVKAVLDCLCSRCKRHLVAIGRAHLIQQREHGLPSAYTDQILRNANSPGAIALFALLIHLEYPKFIICFLERSYNDATSIESWCRQEHPGSISIEDNWPDYRTHDRADSKLLAQRFLHEMYHFAPPVMTDRTFAVYAEKRIMPFYNEKLIGRGTFGQVYGFQMHQDYAQFLSGSTDTRYARKQLSKETEIESFYQEENNLERVRQLQDLHIVQITKSYRKGSDFNIVFPRAKANLRQCLTMPEYSFHDLTTGPIRQAGIWVQMRGLARALDRIINYDPRVDNSGVVFQSRENKPDSPQILGYHFDLKPANILVYDDEDGENNILKISDFGQAKFNARVEDSRTTNPGGTDIYAAPEAITDSESRLNTRYDIWSLGCIFLELVTFLLRKYQGVQDFENARRKQVNRQISSRYFDELRDPLRGQRRFVLRNAVKEWIEDLLSPEPRSDDHDAKFLLEIKGLLLGMLEVDARKRYSSKQVYLELERITAEAVTLDVSSQAPVLNDLSSEEVEINGQKIGTLSRLYARNKRQPQANFTPARLFVMENSAELAITTVTLGIPSRYERPRSGYHFVPKFALRKSNDHRPQSDWDFRFITKERPDVPAGEFEYQCSDLREARIIQGCLTGHDVRKSFELTDLSYSYYRQWLEKKGSIMEKVYQGVKGKLTSASRNKLDEEDQKARMKADLDSAPFTLQIWKELAREQRPALPTNTPKLQEARQPRAPLEEAEVAASRIVIFRSKKIIIIPFSDATRLAKEEDQDTQTVINIVPQKKWAQPFLIAATVTSQARNYHELPSIPTDIAELREIEARNVTKFEKIGLTFSSVDDASSFRSEYLELKKAWDNERLALGLPIG